MLAETMTYHRELGNQITHEKLTGSAIFERPMLQLKSVRQNLILKQLCLYQHSARCPVALHVFLDCNPIYWCFIPLPRYEALLQDFACLKEVHVEKFDLAFNVPTMYHTRTKSGKASKLCTITIDWIYVLPLTNRKAMSVFRSVSPVWHRPAALLPIVFV
ncbi:unnamed protein product [Rotaria socialis]